MKSHIEKNASPEQSTAWDGFHPSGAGERVQQRLSEETRALAERYLKGEVGRQMTSIDERIPGELLLEIPTQARLYAEAVKIIAEKAPLRISADELLVGAATLKEATGHVVPVIGARSISHTTLGFEKALRIGLKGIREEIQERLSRGGLDSDGIDLLNAMISCLDSARHWHERHEDELKRLAGDASEARREHFKQLLEAMRNVPENPPQSFREALQALWLLWDFQRLCGNWSGIGRIDKMLGPFLKADLASGAMTLDGARELIAHFWIKGCEWITGDERLGGDAQFYQNIILAGIDENGGDVTNEVTYLILDVVEELHISDFPIAVRLSSKSEARLLRRIAEVQKAGGGTVAVYNEDRIIPSLIKFSYPPEEARNFCNDGCWEILIPGKTSFSYSPFDMLPLLQSSLGLEPGKPAQPQSYASFEELYQAFKLKLAEKLTETINNILLPSTTPSVLVDLMVEGCIEKGRSYNNLGPKYTVQSPHAGGLQDAANSLLAIKRLVYEERKLSLAELIQSLQDDWNGREDLRLYVREQIDYYGNDSAEADAMVKRVYDDYTGLAAKAPRRNGILRPAGISSFGRECGEFLPKRMATAAGSKKGDFLATNFSPTPGSDKRGPTAVIKSHCAMDFSMLPCGTALELKLSPSSVQGERGTAIIESLTKGFVSLGGIFMQVDVIDSALLRDAQAHPERHPNLAVRISGWSARFATLARNWQDLLINRSEQKS